MTGLDGWPVVAVTRLISQLIRSVQVLALLFRIRSLLTYCPDPVCRPFKIEPDSQDLLPSDLLSVLKHRATGMPVFLFQAAVVCAVRLRLMFRGHMPAKSTVTILNGVNGCSAPQQRVTKSLRKSGYVTPRTGSTRLPGNGLPELQYLP